MIELYYWPTPHGHKITMFLEEAELPYRIHPVDISAGDRFKPEFLRISQRSTSTNCWRLIHRAATAATGQSEVRRRRSARGLAAPRSLISASDPV